MNPGFARFLEELDQTILIGWPYRQAPTPAEARAITETYHELSLSLPVMDGHRRWYLAGQIIARLRREKVELS